MTLQHDTITKLTVFDRDGFPKEIEDHPVPGTTEITGQVAMEGGVGFSVFEEDNEIVIQGDLTGGADDPCFRSKYEAILAGGTHPGCYGEGPCDFNSRYPLDPDWRIGAPYWISTFNKISANDKLGLMWLLGSVCGQMGIFSTSNLNGIAPSPHDNTLELFDLCAACMDCGDYQKLYVYLERILQWLDANKDNNLVTGTRLFRQYQATINYWNYLVHSQSLIFIVQPMGADLGIKVGYRAADCGPFINTSFTVTVTHLSGQPHQCVNLEAVHLEYTKRPDALKASYVINPPPTSSSSYSSASGGEGPPSEASISYLVSPVPLYMSDYIIADLKILATSSGESGCGAAVANQYRCTCVWQNTHAGSPIRTKTVEAGPVASTSSSMSLSVGP